MLLRVFRSRRVSQAFGFGGGLGKVERRLSMLNVFDSVHELRDGTGIGIGAPQYGPPHRVCERDEVFPRLYLRGAARQRRLGIRLARFRDRGPPQEVAARERIGDMGSPAHSWSRA